VSESPFVADATKGLFCFSIAVRKRVDAALYDAKHAGRNRVPIAAAPSAVAPSGTSARARDAVGARVRDDIGFSARSGS